MARTIPTCSALALALLLAVPARADTPDLAAYLRARAADGAGDGAAALAAYRAALAAAPDNVLVAVRAYREALAAGDGALARRAALVLDRAGVAPMDVALLPLADAARAGDRAALFRARDRLAAGRLRVLVPALDAWIATPAAAATADPAARRLRDEARALRLLADGRGDDGLAAFRALSGPAARATAFRLAAAELLLRAGRAADAGDLVGPSAVATLDLAGAPPADLAWGVSRLLFRVAEDLDEAGTAQLGTALVRAALDADPGFVRARPLLAAQIALSGDPDLALAELDRVPAGALPDQVAAQRIDILNRADRLPAAIAVARLRAEAAGATPLDRARYADLLFADGRPADALPFYARTLKDAPARDSWAAWLRYGGALDEAGRWKDAERALRRAVRLAPDEPGALNYLGYSLVDRRTRAAEGTAMLERAHALAPEDAAIADSLGWAYHLAGDTARGLPLVEGAAADLPTDPEVGDHLGDIYWSLGRRWEARYAWTAAQVTAAPLLRARIAAKLQP